MAREESVLHLTPEQKEAAMSLFSECPGLREFGCRVLECATSAMTGAEAQRECGAARGERGGARENSRNGHGPRSLKTASGDLSLRVPKLRRGTYSPEGLLGRYTRVEAPVAGPARETCVAGVSTRKAGRVASGPGVSSLSSPGVSSLCSGLDAEAGAFRARDLGGGARRCVRPGATYMKCRVEGRCAGAGPVTAIGLAEDGRKGSLGCDPAGAEPHGSWAAFLSGLRARGLRGVRLVVSDDHAGLVRAVSEASCGCAWQRCVAHLRRNLQGHARTLEGKGAVAAPVGAATTRRDPLVARAVRGAASPWVGRVSAAAGRVFDSAREDAPAFMSFPGEHWRGPRANNVQERANREVRRRARSVQTFPSAGSLLRLVGCVLMGEEGRWASQRLFSPASAARALAPAAPAAGPDAERLEAARLYASQIVGEVVDRFGLKK